VTVAQTVANARWREVARWIFVKNVIYLK